MSCYKYLVVTDLDGTLLNSDGKLSDETVKYVQSLNERKDILFTFSTGRTWRRAKDIYDQLQLKGFASCCNAAFLYNPHTNQKFYCYLSVSLCLQLLSSPLIIDQLRYGVVVTEDAELEFTPETVHKTLSDLKNMTCLPYGIRLFYNKTATKIDEKIQTIKQCEQKLNLIIYKEYDCFDFEIQAGFVDKEFAIKYLSNLYGVKAENILSFGDSHNDIPVMQGCSRSYAVSNALIEVKQYAKFISQYSHNDDAVIKEVKKFLENKNSL